jgi:putative HTH-type transcriptional regulator yffB
MIIFLYGGTNMRLSSGWEQSVYVLLMLDQLPEGKYINTISLSERLEVSDSYLKKIIKLLDNEGLVKSVRGKNGGIALSKPLSQITFYDVFVAIEGKNRIFESQNLLKKFLGNEESKKAKRCVVTSSLDIIENTLVATLTSITLSQVAHQSEINYDLTDIRNWINKCEN